MKEEIFSQDKIFSHIDKIYNWLKGDLKTLVTVELDMTNRCDSRCPKCSGWFGNSKKDSLTKQQAQSIIEQLVDLEVRGLIFTGGGEPLLNPYTIEMVEYAKRKGLDVGFITNGLNFNKESIETIVRNCVWCRVSLDAGTPEMYKQTHGLGKDEFNRVVQNVRRLVNFKQKSGSNCTIGVGYLTGKHTLEGMLDFIKLSQQLGVDYAQFRPFHYDMTPVDEELEECKKFETKNFKVLHSKHKYEHFKDSVIRPYGKCFGVHFASVIGADCRMYLCCHMRGIEKYCLGDLNKQSLKEIWSSERKKQVFNSIDYKDCVPFCRADTFNRILWNIVKPKIHKNFL